MYMRITCHPDQVQVNSYRGSLNARSLRHDYAMVRQAARMPDANGAFGPKS